MSAVALLAEASAAGLTLRAEAGRLHWRADAPPPPDLLARLQWHRADFLELLAEVDERAGILEFDGGVRRQQAETLAFAEVLARIGTAGAMSTDVHRGDRPVEGSLRTHDVRRVEALSSFLDGAGAIADSPDGGCRDR